MTPPRPTDLAHMLLRDAIQPGDTVVDATCGNGHDTLFLAEAVGDSGRVIAFDIQASAIESAKAAIHAVALGDRVTWHQQSHASMAERLESNSVKAVMFNLGYLPGEDHDITTEAKETLKALEAAATILQPSGLLSVVCYPGHDAGALEAERVESWMSALSSQRWRIAKYAMLGTQRPAPFLLLGCKTG